MAKKIDKAPRVEMEPEFDEFGHQTRQSMIYGRIDPAYLNRLLLEHKAEYQAAYQAALAAGESEQDARKTALRNAPVKHHLGEIIQIVVTKTICNEYWHSYTPDWKEDMEAYAIENMLLYCHNYDPAKLAAESKNGKNDPYYYLANAATWAFVAVRKNKKKQAARMKFTSLNDNLLATCTTLDQYAGVVKEESDKKKSAAAAQVGSMDDLGDAVEVLEAAYPDKKHDPNNIESPEFGKVHRTIPGATD
jgi:hypothetical protein